MRAHRCVMLTIACVFLVFCLSRGAFAFFVDVEENPHQDAIDRMAQLGILEGRGEGVFDPEGLLNRAEAAKVAGYLMGFTEEDAEAAREWPAMFDDVYIGVGAHEWAVGWINLIAEEGVILGYGDDKYHPGDNLQMAQWATIVIRILGHEEEDMSWPEDYDQMADDLGMLEGLDYAGGLAINRGKMARLTDTSMFDVASADGSFIADIFEPIEEPEDPDEDVDPAPTEITLTVEVTPESIPEGGGQRVEVSAAVTDGDGRPVQGTTVWFVADVFRDEPVERSDRLSSNEAVTDASGQAAVTYTTAAEDDRRQITFGAMTQAEDMVVQAAVSTVASGQAAALEGVVLDPFTGDPVPEADMFITRELGNEFSPYGPVWLDADGRYFTRLPTGDYSARFEIDISQHDLDIPGKYRGSDYEIGEDSMWSMVKFTVGEPGETYSVDHDKGVVRGTVTNPTAGMQLAIIPHGNGFLRHGGTVLAPVADDGSFMAPLLPGTHDFFVKGSPDAFLTGVSVETGEVTDLGEVTP